MAFDCYRDRLFGAYGAFFRKKDRDSEVNWPKVDCLETVHADPFVSAGLIPRSMASPVGLLFKDSFKETATCFLIGDYWIATAAHALPNATEAAGFLAVFNFLKEGSPFSRDVYALAPHDKGFLRLAASETGLDCCLVRIAPPPSHHVAPGRRWGTLPLTHSVPPREGMHATLIHHPAKFDLESHPNDARYERYMCMSYGEMLEPLGALHWHSACTRNQSSGGPLLDPKGRLIGLNKGKLDPEDPDGRWLATPVEAVVDYLRKKCRLTPEQAALVGRA